jgi:hypothetical protein
MEAIPGRKWAKPQGLEQFPAGNGQNLKGWSNSQREMGKTSGVGAIPGGKRAKPHGVEQFPAGNGQNLRGWSNSFKKNVPMKGSSIGTFAYCFSRNLFSAYNLIR